MGATHGWVTALTSARFTVVACIDPIMKVGTTGGIQPGNGRA
jgi:hypothetical protein